MTNRCTCWLTTVVAVGLSTAVVDCVGAQGFPDDGRRVLYNSDSGELFADFWHSAAPLGGVSAEEMRSIIDSSIDELSAVGVDTLSTVVWDRFQSMVKSKVAPDLRPDFVALNDAGYDPLELMIARCHLRGIEFMACFRMNDRHGGTGLHNKGQFIKDHPEWRLKTAPGGMNYAKPAVREEILEYIDELLHGYELDGIEFDYLRMCHVFESGQGQENAHLVTDFTRRARELLDAAARRRGCPRLPLGVRVPQTMEECEYLGFDLATWIRGGLVDYVVPSDVHFTDVNTKTDMFVQLAKGTDCRIYPALHPMICRGDESRLHTLESYRAAVHNFYADGADGFQTYNYQYHWARNHAARYAGPGYMWPGALEYLRALRDPADVARGSRHYTFFPLWVERSPSGFHHDDRIRLNRADTDPAGTQRFRLAEDPSDPRLDVTMQFKAVGLREEESLQISINGKEVAAQVTIRKIDDDGQHENQGRPLEPFFMYILDLSRDGAAAPIVAGDNDLTVRLMGKGTGAGRVTIDELEVYVYVRGRLPADHTAITVERPERLGVDRLAAERIPVGLPYDYKPCVAKMPDGEVLLTGFYAPSPQPLSAEYCFLYRSRDGGKTWSERENLDLLGREPYFSVLKSGVIFITTHVLPRARGNNEGYTYCYLYRSEDGARTWRWTKLPFDDAMRAARRDGKSPERAEIGLTRNVLELQDGTLLFGVASGYGASMIWRSTDKGETWQKSPAGHYAGPDVASYRGPLHNEAFLFEARSGDLLSIKRVALEHFPPIPGTSKPASPTDQYQRLILYRSKDRGQNWSFEEFGSYYGEMYPAVLRLSDGRLLFTFTQRTAVPPNTTTTRS